MPANTDSTLPKSCLRSLLIVTLLALLGLLVIGRGCIFRPATSFPGAHFNRGTNAAWLGVEWVNEPHSPEEIAALADDLVRRDIRHVFVYTTYLKSNGVFNPTYDHAAEFNRALKAAQPDLDVQAWIGLPLSQPRPPARGYVNLADAATRQKIAALSADLVGDKGFDGVHLNPEPMSADDANVLALLGEIRQAIGPSASLSIATPRMWPVLVDAILPFGWHADYYQEVAKRVDQMAVMTYDSSLPTPDLYRLWARFQVLGISQALYGTGVDLFFGVPTSEEKTATHLPEAENMESGLLGVIDGLNDAAAQPSATTGVAIYPYWETDDAEWATYDRLWSGR